MFANLEAIKTLVMSDSTADKAEKELVLQVVDGKGINAESRGYRDTLNDAAVLSFSEAAKILGYKSSRGVYAAVRRGRLRGFYCGEQRKRASGVLTDSVYGLLDGGGRTVRKRGR